MTKQKWLNFYIWHPIKAIGWEWPQLDWFRVLCHVFSSGVEHHICQLADICLPHLVLHALDGEGPEALRHAVLSLHGGLWQPADSSAVHLELREHGTRLRAVCREEKSVPLAFIQGLETTLKSHAVRQNLCNCHALSYFNNISQNSVWWWWDSAMR